MGKKPYHHGDLRNALVHEGLRLLELDGAEAVSLRAVARAVRVSEAAPYSHFAGKRELMAAIAAKGFGMLGKVLEPVAIDSCRSIVDLGLEYIRFAEDHPHLYALMFETSEAHVAENDEVRRAGREAVNLLSLRAGLPNKEPLEDVGSLAAWSLVHGLVMLLIKGRVKASDPELVAGILAILEPGIEQRRSSDKRQVTDCPVGDNGLRNKEEN